MFYENLNISNKIFYSDFIKSLNKNNQNGTYVLGKNVENLKKFFKFLGK